MSGRELAVRALQSASFYAYEEVVGIVNRKQALKLGTALVAAGLVRDFTALYQPPELKITAFSHSHYIRSKWYQVIISITNGILSTATCVCQGRFGALLIPLTPRQPRVGALQTHRVRFAVRHIITSPYNRETSMGL